LAEANGSQQIRLLVCDDHRLLTFAMEALVKADPDLVMVADPVDTCDGAVELAGEHRPDVVLMDIQLKGPRDGIEATRLIKQVSPSTRVVVLTGSHQKAGKLLDAVEAGASGFLDKTEAVGRIVDVIKRASRGEMMIDSAALTGVLHEVAEERRERRRAETFLGQLTEREREILQLLAEGRRNEEIAEKLYIAVPTVKTHIQNILGKLGVHSKLEAVAFAAKNGAVTV
jgi:two-component system, NarL family, response regulator LiaR